MLEHYAKGMERERLAAGDGRLELLRTQDLITRHLPSPPAQVVDVGGGPGAYGLWLASLGYAVHLIDPVPLHVEQAREGSARQADRPLASAELGDARRLERPDRSADAVLLLGPLYHLVERVDRERALREAARVLRPGGLVFAAAISRFASLLDGLRSGFLDDPVFQGIVRQDLASGRHENPADHPYYFTTAYFHLPAEIDTEIHHAGLQPLGLFAVEGVGWLLPDLDQRLADPARLERLMSALRSVEQEPALLGASAHVLAVARRPI